MGLIPKGLKRGDTVALVGVSGCIRDDEDGQIAQAAIQRVEQLGFRVKCDPTVQSRYGYLSGSDTERARALNCAFADDRVDGVWCVKGGYGTTRILDKLDYDVIRHNPKAFIGYSDITALHAAFWKEAGLCTFHGPMPRSDSFAGATGEILLRAIGGQPDREVRNPDGTSFTALRGGVAEGRLVGGNLSLLASLCGTPWQLDTRGRLLFLEDVSEYTYRVDRYLTQLRLCGAFRSCAGVILGGFTHCEEEYPGYSLSLPQVFADLLGEVKGPVVSGLQCGHLYDTDKLTLPLGRLFRLDAEHGTLTRLD